MVGLDGELELRNLDMKDDHVFYVTPETGVVCSVYNPIYPLCVSKKFFSSFLIYFAIVSQFTNIIFLALLCLCCVMETPCSANESHFGRKNNCSWKKVVVVYNIAYMAVVVLLGIICKPKLLTAYL